MTTSLHLYCYISEAKPDLSGGEFKGLVDSARDFNRQHGIHGVLFFDGVYFIQYLEGETTALHTAMQRIQRSPLHLNLTPVYDAAISALHFKAWDLRFNELDSSRTLMDQLQDAEGDLPRITSLFDHTLNHLQSPHTPTSEATQNAQA